jgi:hypothetical protein
MYRKRRLAEMGEFVYMWYCRKCGAEVLAPLNVSRQKMICPRCWSQLYLEQKEQPSKSGTAPIELENKYAKACYHPDTHTLEVVDFYEAGRNAYKPVTAADAYNNSIWPWKDYKAQAEYLLLRDGIKYIGAGAFVALLKMRCKLVIPDSVTLIDDFAFNSCDFEGELKIPNSVTYIGDYAFSQCDGFSGDLVIPNSITRINEGTFTRCLYLNGTLKLPDSVTYIGDYAFDGCKLLRGTLKLPDSVTYIGDYAFRDCSRFTGKLTIPESVTKIGDEAFRNCTGIQSGLEIPSTVTEVGEDVFLGCNAQQ